MEIIKEKVKRTLRELCGCPLSFTLQNRHNTPLYLYSLVKVTDLFIKFYIPQLKKEKNMRLTFLVFILLFVNICSAGNGCFRNGHFGWSGDTLTSFARWIIPTARSSLAATSNRSWSTLGIRYRSIPVSAQRRPESASSRKMSWYKSKSPAKAACGVLRFQPGPGNDYQNSAGPCDRTDEMNYEWSMRHNL